MNYRGSGKSQSLNFADPVEALRPLVEKPKSEWLFTRLKPAESTSDVPLGGTSEFAPPSDPAVRELLAKMEADDWVGSLKIASGLAIKHPDSAYVHFNHGYCASMLRLDKQAEIAYRKVVEIMPTNPFVWNNLGSVIRNQEQYPQALAAFEKSVSLNPE